MHVYIDACMYVFVCLCACMYLRMNINICMYTFKYVLMYNVYVYMFICIYEYICLYICMDICTMCCACISVFRSKVDHMFPEKPPTSLKRLYMEYRDAL